MLSFLVLFSAELEADPLSQARYRWYGYIAAYIACIFGHRPGVLSNMKMKEVLAAKDKADGGIVIRVSVWTEIQL